MGMLAGGRRQRAQRLATTDDDDILAHAKIRRLPPRSFLAPRSVRDDDDGYGHAVSM